MPDLQSVNTTRVRELCGNNYGKGVDSFRDGSVSNAWRTNDTLCASVSGSSATPYQVTISVKSDGSCVARCTCPAARRQSVCKHASAVLIAWVERPDLFALRDVPAPEVDAEGKTKLKVESEARRIRLPNADRKSLISAGLDKAEALLIELAMHGLLSVTREQVEMVGALAETIETHRLRRLARQVVAIQQMAAAAEQAVKQEFDEQGWGRLLCDTWFVLLATRKALEKEDESNRAEVEDLIGKTWLEKDLRRVSDLTLVEIAYQTTSLASGFRLDTSYLLEPANGTLYTEKQIIPLKLKDAPRKRSYRSPLQVRTAGVYPGFAPLRVKLIDAVEAPDQDAIWDRVLALAETSATAVRQQLTQATANLVAPLETFTIFRPKELLIDDRLVLIVGADDKAIPAGQGSFQPIFALRGALSRGRLGALFCRVFFADDAMVAEPLSVILADGNPQHRLVRLSA